MGYFYRVKLWILLTSFHKSLVISEIDGFFMYLNVNDLIFFYQVRTYVLSRKNKKRSAAFDIHWLLKENREAVSG